MYIPWLDADVEQPSVKAIEYKCITAFTVDFLLCPVFGLKQLLFIRSAARDEASAEDCAVVDRLCAAEDAYYL